MQVKNIEGNGAALGMREKGYPTDVRTMRHTLLIAVKREIADNCQCKGLLSSSCVDAEVNVVRCSSQRYAVTIADPVVS